MTLITTADSAQYKQVSEQESAISFLVNLTSKKAFDCGVGVQGQEVLNSTLPSANEIGRLNSQAYTDLMPGEPGPLNELKEALQRLSKALSDAGNDNELGYQLQLNGSEDVSAVLDQDDRQGTLFPGNPSTYTTSRVLARIMVELGGLTRKEALESRLAARNQAKSELLVQASKIVDSAEHNEKATKQAGWTTIALVAVSALVGVGGFAYGRGGSNPATSNNATSSPNDMPVVPPAVRGANVAPATGPGAQTRSGVQPPPVASAADTPPVAPAAQTQPVAPAAQTPPVASAADTPPVAPAAQTQPVAPAAQTPPVASAADTPPVAPAAQTQSGANLNTGMIITSGATAFSQTANQSGALAGAEETYKGKAAESDASRNAAFAEETRSEGDVSREIQQALDETLKSLIKLLEDLNAAAVARKAAITSSKG